MLFVLIYGTRDSLWNDDLFRGSFNIKSFLFPYLDLDLDELEELEELEESEELDDERLDFLGLTNLALT